MASELPSDVSDLISQHIHSVEQLEVLLLMHRAAAKMSAADVASDLRIDAGSAQRRLEDLVRRGFLETDGPGFVYRTGNFVHLTVTRLAETYRERRVSVITQIFSKPRDEKANAAHALADAFRLKKEPKDG